MKFMHTVYTYIQTHTNTKYSAVYIHTYMKIHIHDFTTYGNATNTHDKNETFISHYRVLKILYPGIL